jgi:RNA polymerase sigma factor (sigma-70 family)
MVDVARLTTGSVETAEEIVQEAFADLYLHFDAVGAPDAYLRRAVVSRCTSWVRRRVTERRHLGRLGPEDRPWSDPDTAATMAAIGRLPARQRAAIVLRYYADLPEIEIAAALGCRAGTVKSLLARARARLAKELNDDH